MKNIFTCLLFYFVLHIAAAQTGLIINEVSQGNAGAREYVELVVVAPSGTCFVDIRNWIIDDNNATFSGGPVAGSGIASGYLRFTNDPQWQNVPTGSIIVIYNQSDVNLSLPPDDPNDSNDDKVYILPGNHSLLESCTSRPNAAPGYAGYGCNNPIAAATWATVGLANSGDAIQVRRPDSTFFHGFSYGNGSCNCINAGPTFKVDACGTSCGVRVYSFTNDNDDNFNDVANYTVGTVPANETPGVPNNPQNTTWRNALLCVLPLPAVTLKHQIKGNQVYLQYQLTDGESVKNLTLQHATLETPFENLAEMSYSTHYVHNLYDNKTHYYRILYQDKDGNTKISNTVQVKLESVITQEMTVYPNPVPHDFVNVMLQNPENGTIQVFNLAGQLIYQTELSNSEKGHTIDVYSWQDGLYMVRFISQKGEVFTQKLLVQSQIK